MRSREIIELLIEDGWLEIGCNGRHHQFKHPDKPGKVTVPHPKASLPKGTVNSILKQAGLKPCRSDTTH
ncbi:type II toxin-antitoxin system HicA family toxin [Pseudomonas sp. PDM20]|uniref:type II toxin-antitoxin system HicA family toxin n=1 Tax=Pseudomonas sp. PDM20 TaxID=2769254 RepID=UPI00177DF8AD|nr:type II toxin-antitoxin system HicA family toxin [Pseudomonas sp. PDM20]MBD9685302.1 type II toxin-antitoxin system HicA family toxin [Pseudomonas sp. PDM20]